MSRCKKVILVNQVLGPFFTDLAETLANRGIDVHVLTGQPVKFRHEAIRVTLGPGYRRTSIMSRAWSWSAFLVFVGLKLLKTGPESRVLAASNPPLLPHVCVAVSLFRRFEVVSRVLDIYPDVLAVDARFRTIKPVFWIWAFLNRLAYSRCHQVITLGEVMGRTLGKYVQNKAVTIIPDWHTLDQLSIPKIENRMRRELGLSEKLVIMYSGNLGRSHDLSLFVAAAEMLKSEPKLHFVIIGEGPKNQALANEVKARGLSNWTFLPWQPSERLPLSLGMADLSIVSQLPGSESAILPCKIYNYMAAGSGLLAVCPQTSDVARILEEHKCGYRVSPNDLTGLVQAIEDALRHSDRVKTFGSNASQTAQARFSRNLNVNRLADCVLN